MISGGANGGHCIPSDGNSASFLLGVSIAGFFGANINFSVGLVSILFAGNPLTGLIALAFVLTIVTMIFAVFSGIYALNQIDGNFNKSCLIQGLLTGITASALNVANGMFSILLYWVTNIMGIDVNPINNSCVVQK